MYPAGSSAIQGIAYPSKNHELNRCRMEFYKTSLFLASLLLFPGCLAAQEQGVSGTRKCLL